MSTPQHCPGFQQHKNLKSFSCKCPKCKKVIEVFSDEFDKEQTCKACGVKIDFTQCTLDGAA